MKLGRIPPVKEATLSSSGLSSPARKASVKRSVVGDAGVDDGAVNTDKGVGDDGVVEARAAAAFVCDNISIETDPIYGDAGAVG